MPDDIPPELLAQLGVELEDEPNDALGRPRNPPRNRPATPRPVNRTSPRMPIATPPIPGPAQQADALQDMADKTMAAFRRENDSRVSQLREARRMQHEKEVEQMRIDALLRRLQQPTSPFTVVPPGGSIVIG